MKFDILTIFPQMFGSYLGESILKRAQASRVIDVRVHNLRDFADDAHHTVDDAPYGGGPGMVFKIEPIARAIASISLAHSTALVASGFARHNLSDSVGKPQKLKIRVVLFSAKGKQFDARMAKRLSKYDRVVLICGRYEGVDERVAQYIADEEVSIGSYVLTGGELAAMVLLDAVARHIPGVLGKSESIEEKRYGVGVPVYTRPETFKWVGRTLKVPNVLTSGDHGKIEQWRRSKAEIPNSK